MVRTTRGGEPGRARLIALNGIRDQPREALCRLARDPERWRTAPPSDRAYLARRLGVQPRHLVQALQPLRRAEELARREELRARELGAEIVTWLDPAYPAALRDLELAPPVLYVRGRLPRRPAIAVVGSRRADAYALETAALFARDLAARGLVVVSGLARGVDSAAHRGALEADGGCTVAVLGCGLGHDYPRGSRSLADAIAGRGAVITEFPIDEPPVGRNFPIRNRIIAALALGTLVVRATPRSGSLITARLASELGRDVYAIPDGIFERGALGTNYLIKDGALLAQHPRDIVESLPQGVREGLVEPEVRESEPPADPDAQALLAAIPPGRAARLEELLERSSIATDRALALLTGLELEGWVRKVPGPGFVRLACAPSPAAAPVAGALRDPKRGP